MPETSRRMSWGPVTSSAAIIAVCVANPAAHAQSAPKCPHGNTLEDPATCDVRIAHQGKYSTYDLTYLGVSNTAFSIDSYALSGKRHDTLEEFIAYTDEEIEDRLTTYLKTHGLSDFQTTTDFILLDLEWPSGVNPAGWWKIADGQLRNQVMLAVKRRIDVARGLMPSAELGLYNTIMPDLSGLEPPEFVLRMFSYHEGGWRGVYDNLDYFVPNVYTFAGPTDLIFEDIEASVRQAIEESRTLRTGYWAGQRQLPLAVLMGLRIFNRYSIHAGQKVPIETARLLLETAQEYETNSESGPGVEKIIYWEGKPLCQIPGYLEQVMPVPQTCGCDSRAGNGADSECILSQPPDPVDVRVRRRGGSIRLTWKISDGEEWFGTTEGFRIAYAIGPDAPDDCDSGTVLDVGLVERAILTGVDPDAHYSCRICAYNADNESTGTVVAVNRKARRPRPEAHHYFQQPQPGPARRRGGPSHRR